MTAVAPLSTRDSFVLVHCLSVSPLLCHAVGGYTLASSENATADYNPIMVTKTLIREAELLGVEADGT